MSRDLPFKKSVLAAFMAVLCAAGVLCYLSRADAPRSPTIWTRRGVIKPWAALRKSVFYEAPLTTITHLAMVPGQAGQGACVAILDQRSVSNVDIMTRELRSRVNFDVVSPNPILVNSARNKKPQILCRGYGYTDVALLDGDGNTVWRLPQSSHDLATAADLDQDGKTEYYIATSDGIQRLDATGRLVWQQGLGVLYTWVNAFEHEGGHTPTTLLALTALNQVHTYDGRGKLLNARQLPKDVVALRVVHEMSEGQRPHLVFLKAAGSSQCIEVTNSDGVTEFEYAVPSACKALFGLEVTTVQFIEGGPTYYAVLTPFSSSTGCALLSLLTVDGKLKYQEILGRGTGLLAVSASAHDGSSGVLFVGDSKPRRVMMYSAVEPRTTETPETNGR